MTDLEQLQAAIKAACDLHPQESETTELVRLAYNWFKRAETLQRKLDARRWPADERAALLRECDGISKHTFVISIVRQSVLDALSPCAAVEVGKVPWNLSWRAFLNDKPYALAMRATDKTLFKELRHLIRVARKVLSEAP